MKGLVCAITGLVVLATGCKNKEEDAIVEYYYYPQKNVYYKPANNHYFYSLDGGKKWDSIRNQSSDEPEFLGEKIVIESEKHDAYTSNEEHLQEYAGTSFDFTSAAAVVTAGQVAERKVERKVVSYRKPTVEKPKKGITKFINKIFGKKKD